MAPCLYTVCIHVDTFHGIVLSILTVINQITAKLLDAFLFTEELVLIKASLSQGQEYHVIHTEVLNRPTHISQMQQDEQGHIYLTTDDGVYGFSVANCRAYTDCCSCVAAKDPFCAYDESSSTCMSVSTASPGSVQDVANGDTTRCMSSCEEVKVTTQQPTSQPTPPKCVESTTIAATFGPGVPIVIVVVQIIGRSEVLVYLDLNANPVPCIFDCVTNHIYLKV